MSETVIVLGASPKTDRYSNKAVSLLCEKGHTVIPVHPKAKVVNELQVVNDISEIECHVDTVTVYVNPLLLAKNVEAILALKPKRIIFNPGTEDDTLEQQFSQAGIEVVRGCTLVMLNTGQY